MRIHESIRTVLFHHKSHKMQVFALSLVQILKKQYRNSIEREKRLKKLWQKKELEKPAINAVFQRLKNK